jgi:polyhydroxyalkanoate synthesis regulator phasin
MTPKKHKIMGFCIRFLPHIYGLLISFGFSSGNMNDETPSGGNMNDIAPSEEIVNDNTPSGGNMNDITPSEENMNENATLEDRVTALEKRVARCEEVNEESTYRFVRHLMNHIKVTTQQINHLKQQKQNLIMKYNINTEDINS